MTKKEKIEEKIKKMNEIRAMYHRRFEEIEKKYKTGALSEKDFEKHKQKYEKRKEKIRQKIHLLEEKLAALKHPG